MKLGIALLVIGVALLVISIPLSIMGIVAGVNQLIQGDTSGANLGYIGMAGVIIGLFMTGIGAVKVFKR